MLPGDLLCKFMKERLEENLEFFKDLVKRDLDRQPEKVNLQVLLTATVFSLTCMLKLCSSAAHVKAVLQTVLFVHTSVTYKACPSLSS